MTEGLPPELLAAVRAAGDRSGRPTQSIEVMATIAVRDGTLTIISVEVWTTHLAVHWLFSSEAASDQGERWLRERLLWRAVDESGHPSVGGFLGGGGGDGHHFTGSCWLAPPPPASWTSLSLTVPSGTGVDAHVDVVRPARPS